MRRSVRPGLIEVINVIPEVPEPLKGGKIVETFDVNHESTVHSLTEWLLERGLDTSDWGNGNTKSVKKLLLELKGDESGLEVWQKEDGSLQPVRVTHVLRAKVCSEESHKRGVFLLNTWQQYGDGRKRIRNGLLSEKLTISEMPLEKNLKAICRRAVTEEEMQCLAEPLFQLMPGHPVPVYDPNYVCPIEVTDEYFSDHVIEIEASKSYPRLLTMYHLYTVDTVCTGLPPTNFNTLEFDHEDGDGHRKLKYVHAWVWTEWTQIRRFLFEGSSLKERKVKGSFACPDHLQTWLGNFDLDLSAWGHSGFGSVSDLFRELDKTEAQLEIWGRTDGVPLLMRVLHVLQLKVSSPDPRLADKFLYQTWLQTADGVMKVINRLMSVKLSPGDDRFNCERFSEETRIAIEREFRYIVDPFFNLDPQNPTDLTRHTASDIDVLDTDLVDHRVDVAESQTFKGLLTLYHLYTCEVACLGLPGAEFASLEVSSEKYEGAQFCSVEPYVLRAKGWCWVTWPQCLDMVHNRTQEVEERLSRHQEAWESQSSMLLANRAILDELAATLHLLKSTRRAPPDVLEKSHKLVTQIQQRHEDLMGIAQTERKRVLDSDARGKIPPSIVSESAEKALIGEAELAVRSYSRQFSKLHVRALSMQESPQLGTRLPELTAGGGSMWCCRY